MSHFSNFLVCYPFLSFPPEHQGLRDNYCHRRKTKTKNQYSALDFKSKLQGPIFETKIVKVVVYFEEVLLLCFVFVFLVYCHFMYQKLQRKHVYC